MTNNHYNDINIPHLFTCPISLELFRDPVTLSTGQTYDRSSIEKWLAMGNLTCPVTMQKLDHDPSLVPNHTLRHLIHQWLQVGPNPHCQIDGRPHDHYVSTIDSLAALENQLQSHDHQLSLPSKLQVLERVRILSQRSPSGNSYLLQLGFLPLLLELVFEKTEAGCSQEYLDFVDQALYFVVKIIPLGGGECLSMLKEDRQLSIFRDLLEHGAETIKVNLCRLIESIASSLHTKDVCAIFGNASKIVHRIILLLHRNSEASNAGARAIWSLCNLESNIENLVKEGAVNGLVTYMSSSEESGRGKRLGWIAMEAIEKLVGVESGKERLINDPKGLRAVVKMVFKISDYDHEGSESAVSALMIVCCGSKKAREEAIREGVLSQLLLLLQSQCSTRTKTKGRMLLKLLRSKWVDDMKTNHVN